VVRTAVRHPPFPVPVDLRQKWVEKKVILAKILLDKPSSMVYTKV